MRLPDGSGADVCAGLRAAFPALRCLVLSGYSDAQAVTTAVRAGASGYLLKTVRGPALVAAVREVARGGTVFGPAAQVNLAHRRTTGDPVGPLSLLTPREHTVLQLIGEGLANRQIGHRLGLTEKTVKNYTTQLLAKLGLERRAQAAILATRLRNRPSGEPRDDPASVASCSD